MIDSATISRIMDAAQIVDVVSEFVTLRKRGVNYIGLCPFHDEKTPSFSVSPSKGVCKCFACGKGGNVVRFIMEHEQLTYTEALKWLARKYGIEVKEREMTSEERQAQSLRESLFAVNQFAAGYFRDSLLSTREGQAVGMAYFRSRGFRDDTIAKFQLGYSPDTRDALAGEALRKGYREEYLEKTGLCYRGQDGKLTDRFRGRVIFPVHTLSGKVAAFGGRVLSAATKNVQMKYVNSPESEIYHKSRELYGIWLAKQSVVKQDRCYLVEGYTDVISMHQSGIENVVASSGTALTTDQIRLIRRFTRNVTVLYDGDSAGIKASLRGIDMLLEEGMNVRVCLLADGDDPDSFARKHSAEECRKYISSHETDFIRFKTALLMEEAGRDPLKRVSLIGSIVRSISVIPEAITRSVYIRETSQTLQMDEKVIMEEVGKLQSKAKHERYLQEQRRKEREAAEASQGAGTDAQGGRSGTDNGNAKANDANRTEGSNDTQGNNPADAVTADNTSQPTSKLQPAGVTSSASTAVQPSTGTSTVSSSSQQPKATSPAVHAVQPSENTPQASPTAPAEAELIRVIIRHGEKTVCYIDTGEGEPAPVTVTEYIAQSLAEDSLEFSDPLYRAILQEAINHSGDDGFTAERYFVNHPDPEISKAASEAVSDRYQLSKYHSKGQKIYSEEERLSDLVPRLLLDFKIKIVEEEMQTTLRALRDPAVSNDYDRCLGLMDRYKELHATLSTMSRNAGDRVVL